MPPPPQSEGGEKRGERGRERKKEREGEQRQSLIRSNNARSGKETIGTNHALLRLFVIFLFPLVVPMSLQVR